MDRFYNIAGSSEGYDREPFAQYRELVRPYNRRLLTELSDILRAFAGLMSDLGRRFGTEFSNGLPTKYIFFGLMWETVAGDSGENKRRDGFPSWSWAGRFNAVEYDINLAFGSLNVHIEWQTPEID